MKTENRIERCWKELNESIAGIVNKKVKVKFGFGGDGGIDQDKEICIYSESLENRYRYGLGDWCRWEIFLHRNGTWTIK